MTRDLAIAAAGLAWLALVLWLAHRIAEAEAAADELKRLRDRRGL